MTGTQKKMPPITIHTQHKTLLSDQMTPVSLYLKLRDHYQQPVLLESNNFRSREECSSFIGLDVLAEFAVEKGTAIIRHLDGTTARKPLQDAHALSSELQQFVAQFNPQNDTGYTGFNGVFGHTNFDAVQYFDTLTFDPEKYKMDIPTVRYSFYRFVISINHFNDELTILENIPEGETSQMEILEKRLYQPNKATHRFQVEGKESSNLTDEAFKQLVTTGKHHCQVGDVFQIVFSRQFSQQFSGDEFNVYRVLRSINPSPYLFYFDYGDYKIFGSSPEAQMVIQDQTARVNPIAGTYRRSGDLATDTAGAAELAKDPKENAEHIMLVDLARNDLSRHCTEVTVKEFKDIAFFSHVIHLVSTVEGKLHEAANPIRIFGDTFPAGTLSGAPKYKALQLINQYENQNRSFYGGAIGFIDFKGNMNQAILIRSFLSQNNVLYSQAGAGIVVDSVEEKELQEVNNKLGALKKALLEAEQLG